MCAWAAAVKVPASLHPPGVLAASTSQPACPTCTKRRVNFWTSPRTILSWGTTELPLQGKSYLPAILEIEQTCNERAYSVVVIERHLRHVNCQAGSARGKRVYLMPSKREHSSHGLYLLLTMRTRFATREGAAFARQQAKAKTALTNLSSAGLSTAKHRTSQSSS